MSKRVIFDGLDTTQQQIPNPINTVAEENKKVDMDNKIINGIVVNTNNVSYEQAANYMAEIGILNSELLELSDSELPISEGFFLTV